MQHFYYCNSTNAQPHLFLAPPHRETLYKLDPSTSFKDKFILELGAGCGFPGLFCGLLGAHVILTDVPGLAVDLLDENIELNKLQNTCSATALDWTNEENLKNVLTVIKAKGKDLDYILATDAIYVPAAAEPFIRVCYELCGPNTKVLFSHPKARVPEASMLFWSKLPESFAVEKVPAIQFMKDQSTTQFQHREQGVFILTKKQ